MTNPFRAVLATAALFLAAAAPATAQQAPTRAITQIAGDLYRFQNNFHFSLFLVTPEGVIATDPINADAATWLKEEIGKRFGTPVRYVVYSHHHADHISGGAVFADTATFVAHANARTAIVAEKRPTAVPTVTFTDRMTLHLGGKRVDLIYPGRSHSDNGIVMLFPDERTVFAVDFISVKRLPFRDLPDSYFPDWIDAIRAVEAIDFDILAPGHGSMGTKQDAADHRRYLEDLHAAVAEATRAGKSVDEMKQSITMSAYRDWGSYADFLPLNIEGMARRVALQRRSN
jgi:glyoxylase-like metal-dependent hydrolase (beta-lactamase superfamily II)